MNHNRETEKNVTYYVTLCYMYWNLKKHFLYHLTAYNSMHICIINVYSKLNRLKVMQNKNLYSYSYFVTLRMIPIFFNSYINSYKIYNRTTNINDMIIYRVSNNNNFPNFTFCWELNTWSWYIPFIFFFAKKFTYFQISIFFFCCLFAKHSHSWSLYNTNIKRNCKKNRITIKPENKVSIRNFLAIF